MYFNYKAKNEKGNYSSGLVEANAEKDAVLLLRKQGLYILELHQNRRKSSLPFTGLFSGISFSDIANFTRQFSTMINSGLTLTNALTVLIGQTNNKTLNAVLEDVLQQIQAGTNLSKALEKYPQYFSKIYIASIKAGEAGGLLDQVLVRLADNLDKEREFRGKIKGAMVYPTIILLGMVAVVFIMMTMVIPQLTKLYKEFNATLPFATQLLISLSDLFVNFWWLMILSGIGAFFLYRSWSKSPLGKALLDKLTLQIPIWGKIKKETILAEFTRTLGLLVGTGLPIIDALNIVAESIDNTLYKEGILDAAGKVEKGFPLGVLLSQNSVFPAIVGQMTRVGEETGKLDQALLKLSTYFESESEEMLKGLTTAIEPLIMIVLGLGVAFLIWAIIMPIYNLTNSF